MLLPLLPLLALAACGGGASSHSAATSRLAPLVQDLHARGRSAPVAPEAAARPPAPVLASAGHDIAAACRRFGSSPWLGGDRVAEATGLRLELPKLRGLRAALAAGRFPRGGPRARRRERSELRRAVAAYVRLVDDAIALDRRIAHDLGHAPRPFTPATTAELDTAMAAHAANASRRLSIAARIAATTAETCLERLSPE